MDCSPSGSSVHGISQARILEWVAIPFCRGSSWPRSWTHVSCIAGGFFTAKPRGKPAHRVHVQVVQSCLTLCDPMDYTVHGILQARILEWVAVLFSRGSPHPRDQSQVSHIAGRFFTSWATWEAHRVHGWILNIWSWVKENLKVNRNIKHDIIYVN